MDGRFPQGDEAFTVAFREAYGDAPSVDAARGYLVARLIDIAVEATGGDFANEQAFHDALLDASQALVGSAPAEERPSATPSAPVDEPDQGTEALNPAPTAALEASQTPTVPIESASADEDAKPTFVNAGWIIAAGIVLIVGAALAYLHR